VSSARGRENNSVLCWPRLHVSRRDGGVIAGVRVRGTGGWERGRRRTEVIYGVVGGHALGNACEDVEYWMRIEEGAAEVGEVRYQYAWVELSLEEAETGVLEASLE
jgi:hypothetical protein